ncbi:2-oxoglutarate-dependent dioxygenase ecdK [Hyphodiscus hymeniophilus]|uniref:2-oxoglutarate-dependent dioxygenase ecdK n=1 Tax=Hyphodiscus hymeniophilus TaxID=353542 RepID=A0A9P7AXN6_9HELO|nr:2-oxoglutarate-dependent dioxygenase ecdK [Hyphodiscus hymeniophilus]
MASTSFPLISFQDFLSGSEVEKRDVAQKLYNAFHTYGWVYLQDFGISANEIDQMFAMSKKYFDRSLDEKLKQTLSSAAVNQGYTPDGAEANGGTDHKECYEHRRFTNDLCPTDTEVAGFHTFMDAFYKKCFNLSVDVLQALALIMNLDLDYFSTALSKADPQLRLLHYMPIERSVIESKGHARITPHTDFGLCTILFQDSVGGLEVDPFHTENFVPATPIRGTCVINVADLLQRLSNDRLRSTMHRVTSPRLSNEQSSGQMLPARYSTAFFVHPSADVDIEPIVWEGEKGAKYEKVNAGEWRTYNTSKNYANILAPIKG